MKRDLVDKPPSNKRRKLTEDIPSESQSPAQSRLSESAKADLVQWLDQADKKDGPIFTVVVPPITKNAKPHPDVVERPLTLNDRNYLEARWTITPMEKWLSMTKYKKLYVLSYIAKWSSLMPLSTVGNQTHSCGDCVLVKPGNESDRDWKAQVHEVRAADEHHVFLRCTWLENPEELPAKVRSTPPYHGRFELVPGNKMDIIDALTVNGPLKVVYWDEANDNEDAEMPAPGDHYWRQTYNYYTNVLSPLRLICRCKRPQHPDHVIIKCNNQACGIWLHAFCLAQNAIESKHRNGSSAKIGKRARKSINKPNGIEYAVDDNGTCAEDETTKAEVLAPESGAPELLITDKKTGEETREAIPCLLCKELLD
ncbi:hypothetical protein E4T47_04262 [Aureobasidium subglaciale]|nr:hypothetical protein E4T47_04262 [Aureobasidium subglaciale]